MKPHETPALSYVFTVLGALSVIAGIWLAIIGKQGGTAVDFMAGIFGAGSGLVCVAIGQALDYLAKSAYYAEQAARHESHKAGKSSYGGM